MGNDTLVPALEATRRKPWDGDAGWMGHEAGHLFQHEGLAAGGPAAVAGCQCATMTLCYRVEVLSFFSRNDYQYTSMRLRSGCASVQKATDEL